MEFLATFGQYSLVFALILSVLLPLSRLNPKFLIAGQFTLIFVSILCLALAFYFSVFSVRIVYEHSYSGSPWFYKIAAVWGNHEGSMLLWLLVLSFCSLLEVNMGRYRPALLVQNLILVVFGLYVLFTSNPFEFLPFVPEEGEGLNPLLRDMAMTFHPPLLYAGYVGLSMVFSYGTGFLISPHKLPPHKWIERMSFWCSFSWIFLTLGVAAGSYWAYYELGWGGFWFWDPVENASIMPWLMATAMLHMLRVAAKTQNFYNWVVLFSIASFSLSVLGTFLVRSGLLVSVHTFASDPLRGMALLAIFSCILLPSLTLFALKWHGLYRESSVVKADTSLLLGVGVLVIVAFTILLGTLYPIGLEVVTGERISVGAPYFQKVLFPFMIMSVVLMSLSMNRGQMLFLSVSLLVSISAAAAAGLWQGGSWIGLASLALGLWLFPTTALRVQNGKLVLRNRGAMFFAHLGFAVSVVAISAQTWETQRQAVMEVGDEMAVGNSTVEFKNVSFVRSEDYISLRGHLIYDRVNLHPEVRYSYPYGDETTEVAFHTNLLRDVYSVIKRVDEGKYLVQVQHKPFLVWIWIGAATMVAGGVLSLMRYGRRYNKT